jgi:hypothetical protein
VIAAYFGERGIDSEWRDSYTFREQTDGIVYNEKLDKNIAT